MHTDFIQVFIVLWFGATPVTYTLPKLYSPTDVEACFKTAAFLQAQAKSPSIKYHIPRMEFGCRPTPVRES